MNRTYRFTLVLDGVDDRTPNLEDALFEAGCDDALINYKNGTVYLDFDREDMSLEQAIISAIKAVESTDLGARIVSVAPEHLVSLSDIAERVSMTKQAISLFVLGERGSKDFPKPILKIANKSPLWRWSAVAEWFYRQQKIKSHEVVDFAIVIEDINAALDSRNKASFMHLQKILNELEPKHLMNKSH
ncbi:MAG: DNA-binding protein [Proteobacteria bacterium]|nr:DNA-binding protein [Pseudomonadota bacterium]